jgi:hypothetical protein
MLINWIPEPRYPGPPLRVREDVGAESFPLIADGFQNGAIDPEGVFYLLGERDAAAVRQMRADTAEWLADERAMNAPFLSLQREKSR